MEHKTEGAQDTESFLEPLHQQLGICAPWAYYGIKINLYLVKP